MKDKIVEFVFKKFFSEKAIKNKTKEGKPTISAGKNSKEGLVVPVIILRYGKHGINFRPDTKRLIFKTVLKAKKSFIDIKKNHYSPKTIASEKEILDIKNYALSLGALGVGFTKVNPDHIFKNKRILYDNVIVISYEMNKEKINLAPSKESGHEVHRSYYELGNIVLEVAEYLRKLGFNAQAGPALGGDSVNYVPLAKDAGIGEIGKHGLLISPKTGPGQRLAAVYTNIENLPFSTKNEHEWVQDFCQKCKKCVRICPGKAIYDEDLDDGHGYKTSIDYKKCAIPFSRDSGCSLCIKECTFYKVDYETLKEKFIKK